MCPDCKEELLEIIRKLDNESEQKYRNADENIHFQLFEAQIVRTCHNWVRELIGEPVLELIGESDYKAARCLKP